MSANNCFKIEHVSKEDLIIWFRRTVSPKFNAIEDLWSGSDLCLGMEILFPGSVDLRNIKIDRLTENDRRHNFTYLQTVFEKNGVEKEIPVEDILKGNFKSCYQFGQWFRSFFMENYQGQPYDINQIRASCKKKKFKKRATKSQNRENSQDTKDFSETNVQSAVDKNKEEILKSGNHRDNESVHKNAMIQPPKIFVKSKNLAVNNTFRVQNVSKEDLIIWFRRAIAPKLSSIGELGTGVDFCVGIGILFPGSIAFEDIKFSPVTDTDKRQNFKCLQAAFKNFAVDKDIPVENLIKGTFKGNFFFGKWFKAFFHANYKGQTYDLCRLRGLSNNNYNRNNRKSHCYEKCERENSGQGDACRRNSESGVEAMAKQVDCHRRCKLILEKESQTDLNYEADMSDKDGESDNNKTEKLSEKLQRIETICRNNPDEGICLMIWKVLTEA
ncbi:uncharacterized protein LOC128247397 [Octopus bimaculoides]|uniref:Calponin-homology (CH) domain-containing protein n=1 Tax=Octopus bimaculoides TaxID=37653 RepID=A0A0L8I386_OCTBM|nr:uncharacterized protein LOC128247397 [Octopus bimaculoides]